MYTQNRLIIPAGLIACICYGLSVNAPKANAQVAPITNAQPAAPAAAQPVVTSAGPPYTIAYKFTTGQVLKYTMAMDMNDQMNFGGKAMPMNMHMDGSETTTVASVDPLTGNATEKSALSTIDMTMNGQPVPPSVIEQTKTMASASIVMSTTGRLVSMDMGTSASKIPGFNPSSFGMVSFLPAKPVNVGDSWTGAMPMQTLGISINWTLTLTGVHKAGGDTIADIAAVYSSTPLPPSTGQAPGPLANLTMNMSGDMTEQFDLDQGVLSGSSGNMKMTASAPAPAAAQSAGGAGMQMTTNMKTAMTLVPNTPS